MNSILSGTTSVLRQIIAGFLPYECPGCGVHGDKLVCDACRGKMFEIGEPYCGKCGRPLPPGVQFTDGCRDCDGGAYHFDLCRSAFLYEPPVSGIVKKFKFRKNVHLGNFLCDALESFILREPEMFAAFPGADAVSPVPLHPFRLVWRGFNQAEMIAERVAKVFGLRVVNCLVRTRNTKPQSRLKMKEREKNVKGAFAMKKGADAADKRIILVDDVMTTGATLNECCRVLRRAGVKEILVLTAARKP